MAQSAGAVATQFFTATRLRLAWSVSTRAIGDGEAAPLRLVVCALAHTLEKAGIEQAFVPDCVEIVGFRLARRPASTDKADVDSVAAAIVGEGDMKRLVDIADPVTERHQCEGPLLARLRPVLEDRAVAINTGEDAARAGWASRADLPDVATDVDEMVVGVAARHPHPLRGSRS